MFIYHGGSSKKVTKTALIIDKKNVIADRNLNFYYDRVSYQLFINVDQGYLIQSTQSAHSVLL